MTDRRDPYPEVGAATRLAIDRAMPGPTLPEARVMLALVARLTSWSILLEPIAASQLATETGMDERAVRRAVASLARRRAIERRASPGYRASTYGLPTPGHTDPGSTDQWSTGPGSVEPPNPGRADQGNPGRADHHRENYARTSLEDSHSRATRVLTTAAANGDDGFAEFWSAWPRKVARKEARKAWGTALGKATGDVIVDGARRHAAGWTAAKTERKFIPYAATWLRGERWNDPAPAGSPNGGAGFTPASAAGAEAIARRAMGLEP